MLVRRLGLLHILCASHSSLMSSPPSKPEGNRAVIEFVLEQFKQMGASESDLQKEHVKLTSDETYFSEWCTDLSWCANSMCGSVHETS